MKKLVLSVILSVVSGACFADGPVGMTVGTNSVKILPSRPIVSATAWTNGIALVQGQVIANNGFFYMAEAAVTSATNEPTHAVGVVNSLRGVRTGRRVALTLQNLSTSNTVYFAFGSAAAENKGGALAPGAGFTLSGYQEAVYMISPSGDSVVVANDLVE